MKSIEFLKAHDINVDKSLELFGDIETYNDTIGEFLLSIEDKINKLATYMQNKDLNNYAIYVHSLKSDAFNFGFEKLGSLALEHENHSKVGDIYYINENFTALTTEVNNAKKIVKEYLSDNENIATTSNSNVVEYENKTILVVDDSNIIRSFVKRIFHNDYDIGTAENGEEAINIINKNKDNANIKAILLDLNMPKVDGFAVLDYMKSHNLFDQIPVSIISGDSSKETIDKAFTYPIIDMLSKPFNDSDVKRVIEKTILYQQMK